MVSDLTNNIVMTERRHYKTQYLFIFGIKEASSKLNQVKYRGRDVLTIFSDTCT